MTRFLRTTSTRRLLATIVGLIAAIGAGTAIAVAAAGSGAVPPPRSLANAIHHALQGPQVQGITARITFTNHLIDASSIQGSDPLLTGATGRLWLSSNHQMRLELQSNNGDAQVVVNHGSVWVYDPAMKTAYQGKLPVQPATKTSAADKHGGLPTIATIQNDINQFAQHLSFSGAIAGNVAGQEAYTVRISPTHSAGLLGEAQLAWDAIRGVPLRFAIYARGSSTPVIELKATDISYGAVPAKVFAVTPPGDAKIVKVATPNSLGSGAAASDRRDRRHAKRHEVAGVAAVARRLPFALVAPSSLVGASRSAVTLLDWNHSPAALVTYGQALGGYAVIEQTAQPAVTTTTTSGDHHQGLSLPTVKINGATAQELDTALGTMIRFTRGGVTYTVLGSVPPFAAEQAARAIR